VGDIDQSPDTNRKRMARLLQDSSRPSWLLLARQALRFWPFYHYHCVTLNIIMVKAISHKFSPDLPLLRNTHSFSIQNIALQRIDKQSFTDCTVQSGQLHDWDGFSAFTIRRKRVAR
jgi:hypothetical protein